VALDGSLSGRILEQARQILDFSRPLAIMLQMIPAEDNPYRIVHQLAETSPPGSYLVITHPALAPSDRELHQVHA
jgi:hypothetical protein